MLRLVAEGKATKEIAVELCVAVTTVSRHITNIYAKIDARNRVDATRYALGMRGEPLRLLAVPARRGYPLTPIRQA